MDPRDFASVTSAFSEPMLLLSARGDLLATNRAAARQLVAKLDAQGPSSILPHVEGDPERVLHYLRDCARNSRFIPGSITLRLDGEPTRCRCDGAGVREAGEPGPAQVLLRVRTQASASEAFVALNDKLAQLNREIAQRKRTEQLLRQKTAQLTAQADELRRAKEAAEQAARTKSQFLANMSHELRTPMNGMLGSIQLLQAAGLSADQEQLVTILRGSSELLLSLLNDILDTARLEAGKLEVVEQELDVPRVVGEVVELFQLPARNKGLSLTLRISPRLAARCYGDARRIRQVLTNLVGNAVKFTPEGTVELSASASPQEGEPRILRFEVRDTGIGIDPEGLDRIFEPFTQADEADTRQFGGSGLGLSLCRGLVEAMGGRIGASSEPGRGSCFWFEVPLLLQPAAPRHTVSDDPSRPTTPGLQSLRVLVAEDNTINRMVVRQMLERLGCEVDMVEDGVAAVDAASHNDYDIILMDIEMPRLDGVAATYELRTRPQCQRTPIVAITAHAFAENKARCLAAGMSDFIPKPIKFGTLRQALAEHTGRPTRS